MSRDIPILFKGIMVRALLAGEKDLTRRVVKDVPWGLHHGIHIMDWPLSKCYTGPDGRHFLKIQTGVDDSVEKEIFCPQGVEGDVLWVRENFRFSSAHDELKPSEVPEGDAVEFAADAYQELYGKARPSIFMPSWASRLKLKNTGVVIERLQDISDEDALREGVRVFSELSLRKYSPVQCFKLLWDSINSQPMPVYEDKVLAGYQSFPWEDIREERVHRGKPWFVCGNPYVFKIGLTRILEREVSDAQTS